jgi:hypothetical protein
MDEDSAAVDDVAQTFRRQRSGFDPPHDAVSRQLAHEWPELWEALDRLQRTWPR